MSKSDEKDVMKRVKENGIPTIVVSSLIIGAALWMGSCGTLPNLDNGTKQASPFIFGLIGVSIYVMSSAKSRRNRFDIRYLPDYFFRGAQATVYIYVIMSIIAQSADSPYTFTEWPPNLLGLLVGMFILYVERAMEGFGHRFEEMLSGLLSRSLTSKTNRERQIERLGTEQKYNEIKSQAEMMLPRIRDPHIRSFLKERLDAVKQVIRSGEQNGILDEVSDLVWEFEQIKQSVTDEEITLEMIRHQNQGGGS